MRKNIAFICISILMSIFLIGCSCGEKSISADQIESLEEETQTTAYDENPVVTIVDNDGTILKETTVNNGDSISTEELDSLFDYDVNKKNSFNWWLGRTENIISNETIYANCAGDPTGFALIGSSIKAKAGENDVVVTIYVQDNPGIIGAMFSITFDEDVMTLESVNSGYAFNSLRFTSANKLASGCNFLWDTTEISDNEIEDGAILELHFNVKNSADTGKYQIVITATDGDLVDNDLNALSPEIKNGSITID